MRRAVVVAAVLVPAVLAGAGPVDALRETTWEQAAAQFRFPVYEPQYTLGLKLSAISTDVCEQNGIQPEEVSATYGDPFSRRRPSFSIVEGHPEICGNDDEARPVRFPRIDGRRATVAVICPNVRCRVRLRDGFRYGFELFLRKRGRVAFQIDARRIHYRALLRMARSLERVEVDRTVMHSSTFQSPDRATWCWIVDYEKPEDAYVLCGRSDPRLSGTVTRRGAVTLCTNTSYTCIQNTNPQAPVLRIGRRNDFDGFLCTSEVDGITCTVAEGPQRGKGFRISDTAVTEVGPGS
jgi:hypothetical protein